MAKRRNPLTLMSQEGRKRLRRLETIATGRAGTIEGYRIDSETAAEVLVALNGLPADRAYALLGRPMEDMVEGAQELLRAAGMQRKAGRLIQGDFGRRGNPDDHALLGRIEFFVKSDPRHSRGKSGNWVTVYGVDPLREFPGLPYHGIWRDEVPVHRGSIVVEFNFKLGRTIAHAWNVMTDEPYGRRGVASAIYRWVENRYGVRIKHSRDQTDVGKAFTRGRRLNPPVDVLPAPVQRFVTKEARSITSMGGDLSAPPLGCGANGCAIPHRDKRWVVKITRDPEEVDLIETLLRIRRGSARRVLSPKQRRGLSQVDMTEAQVAKARGFVAIKGTPRKVDGWYIYVRENVEPLDHGKGKGAARRNAQVRKAIDGFFYDGRWPDPKAFYRAHPNLKTIAQTVLGLFVVHGIRVGDLHEQQVGERLDGTLVLYDGKVEGWSQRRTRRKRIVTVYDAARLTQ